MVICGTAPGAVVVSLPGVTGWATGATTGGATGCATGGWPWSFGLAGGAMGMSWARSGTASNIATTANPFLRNSVNLANLVIP
ncbi:MAG: hypothetical protein WDO13_16920 [Verrucomicrobiota bacterium]